MLRSTSSFWYLPFENSSDKKEQNKFFMSTVSSLKEKEIVGLSFSGEVKLAKFHDDVYVFVTNDDILFSYDTITLKKTIYDPPDKSIKSSITTVALNPSHDVIAVGFLDGSIQLYEFGTPKPSRVLSKARKSGGILGMQFINQTVLVFFDTSNNVLSYDTQLSVQNLFKSFSKEKPIASLSSPGVFILVPPIYRNTSSTTPKPSSKCTMPLFHDTLLLITVSNTALAQYADDQFQILAQFNYGGAVVDFQQIDESTLLIGLFSNSELNIFTCRYKEQPVLIKNYKIDVSCQNLFFINEKMICLMTSDNEYIYVMIDDGTQTIFKADHTGLAISIDEAFAVLSDSKIYQYFLPTFQDSFDTLRNADKLDEAKELCEKAIAGETSVCIGLPSNPSQRFLVVQQNFLGFFDQFIREKVSKENNENALNKLIDQSITISENMHSLDWVTTKLLQIFKEEGKTVPYFKHLLTLDPNAQKFLYTQEFFNELILQKATKQIFTFIQQLPETIAPSALALKYAVDNKEYDLALDFYINRLHDIISCINLLYDIKKFKEMYDNYLMKYIEAQNEDDSLFKLTIKIISWLFAFSKEQNTFPRIVEIIKALNSKKLEIFDKIYNFLQKYQQPFDLSVYFSCLITLYVSINPKDGFNNPLFILADTILIENDVKLSTQAFKLILKFCFSKSHPEPDTREKTLLSLMNRHLLDQMMDQLMPICESLNFNTAKSEIMVRAKKYDTAIQEMLSDESTDVYGFIIKLLTEDFAAAQNSIKTAIENNAPLLLIKDPKQFFELIFKFFPDMLIPVITLLGDKQMQNVFLREILTDERTRNNAQISKELIQQYFEFICTYYPEDVLDFIRNKSDINITEYIKPCRDQHVLDAIVFIDEETGNIQAIQKDLVDLVEETGLRFVEGNMTPHLTEKKLEFVQEMMKILMNKFSKDPTIEGLFLNIIKALAIPLFMVKDLPDTKEEGSEQTIREIRSSVLSQAMHKIVTIATNKIAFDKILRFLLKELSETRFGEARQTLMSVINDYAYDVDTDVALAQLFIEDESHGYENYIMNNIQGLHYDSVICGTCGKKLASSNQGVKIFKCGHSFHTNCLMTDKCPICEGEKIGDESQEKNEKEEERKVKMVVGNKMKRYEMIMARSPELYEMDFFYPENDVIVETPTATSLPL